jgi:hypothetical protein
MSSRRIVGPVYAYRQPKPMTIAKMIATHCREHLTHLRGKTVTTPGLFGGKAIVDDSRIDKPQYVAGGNDVEVTITMFLREEGITDRRVPGTLVWTMYSPSFDTQVISSKYFPKEALHCLMPTFRAAAS